MFTRMVQNRSEAHRPLVDAFRDYSRNILLAMGMRLAENGTFYIFTVFVLSYGTDELKLPKSIMLGGVILSAVIGLFSIPAFGALSDRVGRRPVYLFGALFTLLFAFPFFWLINSKSAILVWLAIMLAVNVGHDAMYGPQAAYFSELFGARVRYTGASLSYQLTSVFAGGFRAIDCNRASGFGGLRRGRRRICR